MTTTTVDGREMLRAGIMYALATPTTGLLGSTGIVAAWPHVDLTSPDVAGTTLPFVVVAIGQEKTIRTPGAQGSAKDALGTPTTVTNADGSQTTTAPLMKAINTLQAPVTVALVAGGAQAKTTLARLRAAVRPVLGADNGTSVINLPDSVETGGTNGTPATIPGTFALTALLTYTGGMEDNRNDLHGLYRYNLMYTATYTEYRLTTARIAAGVAATLVLGPSITVPPPS